MNRMHITKHDYEDMFEELYPNVRKQYRIRMNVARVALILAILFTLYIFTIGECRRLPFIGSIAEKQQIALAQETIQNTEQKKGEDRNAERISDHEYAGFSLASQ